MNNRKIEKRAKFRFVKKCVFDRQIKNIVSFLFRRTNFKLRHVQNVDFENHHSNFDLCVCQLIIFKNAIETLTLSNDVVFFDLHVVLNDDDVQHFFANFLLNDLIIKMIENENVKTTNFRLIDAQHSICALHNVERVVSRVKKNDFATIFL